MAYLLSPMVPLQLLEAVQGLNIVIIILSKVMYQTQSICSVNYCISSAIRVFFSFLK